MRIRSLLLLTALALAASPSCAPPVADAAAVTVMALGDTARIAFHWPAVNKATGYTYTISAIATNGTWVGLPVSSVTTATSGVAIATSATADTAVFQLCATATGAAGASSPGCSTSVSNAGNTWRRKLASPQPVLDSATVSLVPSPLTMTLASARMLCAFLNFKDGQVGERTADRGPCDSLYVKAFPPAQRVPTSAEQAFADADRWSFSAANPAAIGLVPQGLGSSAVLVQGNGLTLLGRVEPLERYAAATWPVYRVDSIFTEADGRATAAVTCLRPGVQTLVVTAEKARTEFPVVCRPAPWQIRIAADAVPQARVGASNGA